MSIASTIWEQLGGRRFQTMTGARQFIDHGRKLSFRLSSRSAANKANYVEVGLDDNDTYTVQFCRIFGLKITEVSTREGIYCDQLQEVFTAETGLYTHL